MGSSWCCEFRNAAGVLTVFEISGAIINFGLLCARIATIPGVEFAAGRPPARFITPIVLRFKGHHHEACVYRGDHRISAKDPTSVGTATEELLEQLKPLIKRRVLRKR